jgi:hypothetical protein
MPDPYDSPRGIRTIRCNEIARGLLDRVIGNTGEQRWIALNEKKQFEMLSL